ncbi:MAG: hypothetical protein Pyrs2KO_08870 [Pyruvatibacter sp.]
MLAMTACDSTGSEVYSLYRGSVVSDLRIHVATFDADEGNSYNFNNCQVAADLFEKQPGVVVRYWCEKGHAK